MDPLKKVVPPARNVLITIIGSGHQQTTNNNNKVVACVFAKLWLRIVDGGHSLFWSSRLVWGRFYQRRRRQRCFIENEEVHQQDTGLTVKDAAEFTIKDSPVGESNCDFRDFQQKVFVIHRVKSSYLDFRTTKSNTMRKYLIISLMGYAMSWIVFCAIRLLVLIGRDIPNNSYHHQAFLQSPFNSLDYLLFLFFHPRLQEITNTTMPLNNSAITIKYFISIRVILRTTCRY